jgi:hypothetical protein
VFSKKDFLVSLTNAEIEQRIRWTRARIRAFHSTAILAELHHNASIKPIRIFLPAQRGKRRLLSRDSFEFLVNDAGHAPAHAREV